MSGFGYLGRSPIAPVGRLGRWAHGHDGQHFAPGLQSHFPGPQSHLSQHLQPLAQQGA